MRIELTRQECGNNQSVFPEGGDDDPEVSCAICNHLIGSMGDLKDAVAAAVIARVAVPNVRKKRAGGDGR